MALKKSNSAQIISMERISDALNSTNTKKEKLRRAFEFVKSHSSTLSSFTLQWKDLEEHFDSLQKTLEERFKQLETKENQLIKEGKSSKPIEIESVVRSELKSFCLKMDGIGLRCFIMDRRKDLPANLDDVCFALQSAPDPAKLVLDALRGFYPLKSKREKGGELGAIRRTCVLLFDGLNVVSPEIKDLVKEEAKKLAFDWKQKVSTESDDQLEALVFLQLLGTYGLASEFSVDELLDLLVSIARRKQAVDLFKGLGFQDKIHDFIQKLSIKGKQVDAVKFVYAFDMAEKFPPVPLLKAYLKESKKIAHEVRKKGNNSIQSQNEAIAKETAYLRAMIKCIEEYKLESQYSRESLDKRIELLEKQKAERKRPAVVPSPSPASKLQQLQQQSGHKRPCLAATNPADVAMHTFAPSSQIHLQPTGLLPEQVAPYPSSSSHYGLVGNTPTISHYLSAAAGPSGVGAATLNIGGNQSPSLSHHYSSESQLPSSVYDRSSGFGQYGLLPLYRSSSFFS